MIEVIDIVKRHGTTLVLDKVRFAVQKGEIAVVIGPSGGGKSTLLRCINGLEAFEEGEVRVGDMCLRAGEQQHRGGDLLQRLRQRVTMVFQHFHLFANMTVLENVLSGPLYVLRKSRAEAEVEAKGLLSRVGLSDKLDARPDTLSGGQQQRVAIARSLAMNPEVVLFDEPTSALDPKMSREVLSVMTDLAREGQTMIVVTHAMGFARRVAQTVHVMACGKIVEGGPPGQIFEHPQQPETRTFLARLLSD